MTRIIRIRGFELEIEERSDSKFPPRDIETTAEEPARLLTLPKPTLRKCAEVIQLPLLRRVTR